MTINPTRRLGAAQIRADYETLIAVQNLQGYAPSNANYSAAQLTSVYHAMQVARSAEILAQNALNAARVAAIKAEQSFHNAILGAKDQVIAQYGADSDAVEAIGLKKRSARKRPTRRAVATKQE